MIALVELRDNLSDLACVLPILGPSWDAVYSDWMDDPGGNHERIRFLFDRRAVTFNGLATEVDSPREKETTEYLAQQEEPKESRACGSTFERCKGGSQSAFPSVLAPDRSASPELCVATPHA